MNAPLTGLTPTGDAADPESLRGADILILSAYYHPEPTGSAPPITDLSFWLAKNGADVRVLTGRPSYPARRVFEGYRRGERDTEQLNEVAVRRLGHYVSESPGLLGRFATEFSLLARLAAARALGGAKPARHVICVCPSVFVVAAAGLFRRRGGRVLCIVHDIQSGLGRSLGFKAANLVLGPLRAVEMRAYNGCDVLVALSDEMADELRRLGVSRPIVVLPPQIDIGELTPLPEPADEAPALLYSGNLGRKQGLDQVLALAGALQARGSRARIVIRGQGSERAELERQAAADGLTNVAFEDLAPRERLNEAMAEGIVHLAPQHPDGATFAVPSKVFSIMAAERPFLATARRASPLWNIAQVSRAGVCVEPYQPEALADAAEQLLADPALRRRMGKSGRAYVARNVDREIVCRRLWDALSEG
ncbi:glycosyltransferase family 4 protein [Phenylobacterium sp.]|uniref:glycosyltransferase family 4 protein n=1 Tax=Phenylobacterium sp. TaxID=1871053 RepID=UPI0026033A62|nr:glycosyltransferase family 4 protein [Phenylobacterium sp.]